MPVLEKHYLVREKKSIDELSKTFSKITNQSPLERKMIGEGTYGCAIRPPLKLTDSTKHKEYKNYISKVFNDEETALEENVENKRIKAYDPSYKWHLKASPVYEVHNNVENRKEVNTCKKIKMIPSSTFAIQYEDGGMDLSEFFSKNASKFRGKNGTKITTKLLKSMKNLLQGVSDMAKNKMAHLDIKTLNIVYNDKTDRFNFIDFGLACKYDKFLSERDFLIDAGYYVYPIDLLYYTRELSIWTTESIVDRTKRVFNNSYLKYYNEIYSKNGIQAKSLTNKIVKKNIDYLKSYDNLVRTHTILKTVDSYSMGLIMCELYKIHNKTKIELIDDLEKYEPEFIKGGTLQENLTLLVSHFCNPLIEYRTKSEDTERIYEMFLEAITPTNETKKSKKLIKTKKIIKIKKKKTAKDKTEKCNEPSVIIKFDNPKKSKKSIKKSIKKLSKEKQCPPDKVLNPKTRRCILKNGALAKKLGLVKTSKDKTGLLKSKSKTKKISKSKEKQCPPDKVLNPKTRRCISKNGVLAKKLGL